MTLDEITVSRAHGGEIATCAAIHGEVLPEIEPNRRHEPFHVATNGELLFLARVGHEAAGFLSLWPQPPFVHFLLVHRPFRRRGVGRALLDTALRGIREPVDLKVAFGNEAAIEFYRRLGWRPVGHDPAAPTPFHRLRLVPPPKR